MPPNQPNRQQITVTFTGSEIDNEVVDMELLLPALLAFGRAFKRANYNLNGDNMPMVATLKATNRGSLEILLDMVHVLTTAASQANATQLLASQLFKDVRQLAHLMLWIYKITIWSKGDEITSEQSGNGTVLLTRETETELTQLEIPVDADILWNNKQIRRDILATVSPLSGGVDAITVADTTGDSVSIETSDLGYFHVPELPPEKDRVEERAYLNVVAPAFERGQGWRMRRREKGTSEWYYVMDVAFLDEVDNGALRFGKYDVLECSVSTVETTKEDGTTSPRREIVKVHQHYVQGQMD